MERQFLHGAVLKLTREDTPEDIACHFARMKESGFNTVVIWPSAFWWEEKREGYPFNTGKLVLELAERAGIGVVMELAGQLPQMEYIPDFLMKDEYYCLDEQGHRRLKHGSFGYLNYFHPEVDRLICEHFAKTAAAYRDYPALIAYDIFNETAFRSYDEHTMAVFRQWLKEKYGTIQRLNEVWERCYTDFSQISYAPWIWMSIMPSADMTAFRKESVAIFLRRWGNAIRAVDDGHPLWADNVGSMICNGAGVLERPQEDFLLKEAVDEIGISFYPKQVTGTVAPSKRWCTFDSFFAASKREGFLVAEMQTHIQAMFNPTTCVRPHELKQWCCEALAGGAKGLIYWMWRPFTKGLQTAGRGLVDYKGRSTPRLELAREMGKLIAQTGVLHPTKARVGILFDGTCQDFQNDYTKSYKVDQNIYLNSICGAYNAFFDANVRADIVKLHEIENYSLLILTNHIVIGKECAARLKDFVRRGGVILCDGRIGSVDEWAVLNDTLPGGALNDAMGLEFIDTDYEGLDFVLEGKKYRGYYGRELTAITDGEVLGTFEDGEAAVVRKQLGKGEILTLNTSLWYGHKVKEIDAAPFAAMLADRYHLRELKIEGALKVRTAKSERGRFAFVFNYTDAPQSGRICGGGFDTELTVPANGTVILKAGE